MRITKRISCILISALAVISLFVSSVSACSCSHHQQEESAESISCHAASHHDDAGSAAEQAATSIDEDCTCFASQPSPYVVNKSEAKKVKDSSGFAEAISTQPEFAVVFDPADDLVAPLYSRSSFYSSQLVSFRPARAPPRL